MQRASRHGLFGATPKKLATPTFTTVSSLMGPAFIKVPGCNTMKPSHRAVVATTTAVN
jgi:hypothetical protein